MSNTLNHCPIAILKVHHKNRTLITCIIQVLANPKSIRASLGNTNIAPPPDTNPTTHTHTHTHTHTKTNKKESCYRYTRYPYFIHSSKGPTELEDIKELYMDGNCSAGDDAEVVKSLNGKESATDEGHTGMEPYVGMEYESEEAAKAFYDGYATRSGFIMRVDAFRRSMRDASVVWRRLVCNKEGFRKAKPRLSENRKPRAITREGCKAMLVVKKEKTGKWVVTRFTAEHNHPLVLAPANTRRNALLSQTPDEKDAKIRELTAELHRERKRSAALQQQLDMVLKDMEEHSKHLSRNIDDIVKSMKEIESKRVVFPHNS